MQFFTALYYIYNKYKKTYNFNNLKALEFLSKKSCISKFCWKLYTCNPGIGPLKTKFAILQLNNIILRMMKL